MNTRSSLFSLVILALVACDDGGGGGGGTVEVDTEIEESKKVSELTEEEAQQFCDRVEAIYEGTVDYNRLCEAFGAAFTPSPDICRQSIPECVQSFQNPEEGVSFSVDPGAVDCMLTDSAARENCDVTIEELEACWGDAMAAANGVAVSCNDAGNAARLQQIADAAANGPEDIPSCAPIAAACPGLIQDPLDAEGGE